LALYIIAAAVFAFYLAAVPMKIAFVFTTKPQIQLRSGSSAFEGRFALRRALKKKKKKRSLPDTSLFSPALQSGKYLSSHTRFDYLRVSGVISEPDAAHTALLFGFFESLRCASPGSRVQVCVTADFSGSGSDLTLHGMISLRAGHIIFAAFRFALKFIEKRLKQWTKNIRLKISCKPRWKASAT